MRKNTICLWLEKDAEETTVRRLDVAAIEAAMRG